jgi:CheY-like chemotaxis protein
MDRRETVRRIRARSQSWRNIAFIALTADAMSGDRECYNGMWMDDDTFQPIDGRELAICYIRLLQNQRRDAAAA